MFFTFELRKTKKKDQARVEWEPESGWAPGEGSASHCYEEIPPSTSQAGKGPGALQAVALKMVYAGSGCQQPSRSWQGACPYLKEHSHIPGGEVGKTQSVPWITHINTPTSVSKVSSSQTRQSSLNHRSQQAQHPHL